MKDDLNPWHVLASVVIWLPRPAVSGCGRSDGHSLISRDGVMALLNPSRPLQSLIADPTLPANEPVEAAAEPWTIEMNYYCLSPLGSSADRHSVASATACAQPWCNLAHVSDLQLRYTGLVGFVPRTRLDFPPRFFVTSLRSLHSGCAGWKNHQIRQNSPDPEHSARECHPRRQSASNRWDLDGD